MWVIVNRAGDRFNYEAHGIADAIAKHTGRFPTFSDEWNADPAVVGAYKDDNGWVGLQ